MLFSLDPSFASAKPKAKARTQSTKIAKKQTPPKVEKVIINGNERVDEAIVKNYLILQENSQYNDDDLNTSIKALYESGLFKDVNTDFSDGKLTITVFENPLITEIGFDGNKKLDDNILSSEITSTKRSVFNKNRLNNDVKRILDIYRSTGRFLATVEPKIVEEPNNRIKLVFEINEGKPAKVRDIHIIGAKKFTQRELKAELQSKESSIFRFGSSEAYSPMKLEYDKELLRRFYYSKGYPDFEVLSAVGEIDRNSRWFDITFLIEEGEKYRFGDIKITNNIKKMDNKKLEKAIKIKSGKVFNANLIETSVDSMTNELAKEGFAFVNIRPMMRKNEEEKVVSIDFVIDESPRMYVGEISIIGNSRTFDSIIRRELRLEEGDPFNIAKLNRSIQRLNNLGYFEKVDVKRINGKNPNQIDLIVEVQEKKTGEFQFGVGYSTVDGPNVNVGIRETNLLGRGQTANLNVVYAKYTKDISLSYGKPYFLGRDLYAGFSVFYRKDEDEYSVDYKETSYGGSINTAYSITEYLDQRWFYSIYQQDITDVGLDYQGIITKGENLTSMIGQTLSYDRRDNKFETNSGFLLNWSIEYAGLGGDKRYIKNTGLANFYIPIWPSIITLRLGAKGGIIEGIGKPVDPVDAFYLGGTSFKGFKYGGIGPRTINPFTGSAKDGSAVGGKIYYAFDAELKFPLGLPKEYGIYGSVFINAGTVRGVDSSKTLSKERVADSGSIRSAYGVSLSWRSPMGPISIDFSRVLKKESYDESQNFTFNFGTSF